MIFNLQELDKYESNHAGYGKKNGKTRKDVHTGKIHKFVRSNAMTHGAPERQTLFTHVIIVTF